MPNFAKGIFYDTRMSKRPFLTLLRRIFNNNESLDFRLSIAFKPFLDLSPDLTFKSIL